MGEICAELVQHTIATGIGFGYQVLATDLNRDGRPDVIALGAHEKRPRV